MKAGGIGAMRRGAGMKRYPIAGAELQAKLEAMAAKFYALSFCIVARTKKVAAP
jgi:hypothetical protein